VVDAILLICSRREKSIVCLDHQSFYMLFYVDDIINRHVLSV